MLGCGDRIVGVSGFTMRPSEARKKPKVSAYTEANYDKILSLNPDLVLTFSDLQADITAELMRRGVQVVGFNQRSIGEILQAILLIGSLVGKSSESESLVEKLSSNLAWTQSRADGLSRHPNIYFEEWYDPLISGICWVSELVEIAGGVDIFRELRSSRDAKGRIVHPKDVVERNPEIIIGSWCGKQFRPDVVRSRVNWSAIDAVRHNKLFEIKSTIILQPGPASLTDGLKELSRIIHPQMLTE